MEVLCKWWGNRGARRETQLYQGLQPFAQVGRKWGIAPYYYTKNERRQLINASFKRLSDRYYTKNI